ncbi:MoaD/ThiS family protein [uncultured Pseudodesulfovibrio sp.]|uniref:MoaD/ThiS family protein n=1 Tax=uncultured Pseudodesulfovibrio sp. TaxID=2035858 RepID=UPI0029C75D8A|nr:MoaD/ThiS family protein [uncultured Pseudodesulfovibrio sp.]
MGIEIKCFATLARFLPENGDDYPLAKGETVKSLVDALGIPEDEIALIFINSCRAYLESELADGDRVGLFPPVGGG